MPEMVQLKCAPLNMKIQYFTMFEKNSKEICSKEAEQP